MKYVYIPVSLDTQPFYVGITGDVRARLVLERCCIRRITDLCRLQ